MVTVAWEDVISVVSQIAGYLAVIGIAFIAMIIVMVAVRKVKKPKKGFIRMQSLIAFLAVTVITVNAICLGPERNMITAAMAEMGTLSEETINNSRDIIERTAEEGIVMLKNDDGALPLEKGNLNVFGWASTNPVYGGTGSGTVDASTAVSILDGLENAGFTLNTELSDMYTEYRADRPVIAINDEGQEWTLPEVPAEDYSEEMLANAQEFSDTALIVLARSGGEGSDLPHDMGAVMDGSWNEPGTKYLNAKYQNNSDEYEDYTDGQTYLELSQTERNLVDMVCGRFDNVVVVYNGSNTLEMGWVDEYEQINGVLTIPGAGATGFNALGSILAGEVNPSGKTADTWVYDLTATPYFNNIGHMAYTNVDDVVAAAKEAWDAADGVAGFVNYVENIYVGYRFYETAAEEGIINYDETVQYPFGYGLSYTTFTQEMGELQAADGTLSVDVTVTNTGDTAGKDVVEIYYNPPYTNGGIEKASVNLIAMGKTDMLEPGESQTLTLSFTEEEMAAYDTYGNGCYVLEAGTYEISLRTDSHTVVTVQNYTVSEEIVYGEGNARSDDEIAAVNQLQSAEGTGEYLSRADRFANLASAIATPGEEEHEIQTELLATGTYDPTVYNNADDEMPTTEAGNDIELFDLRGAGYDDERWEELLDNLSIDDMKNLIAYGGFQTVAVDSVGKVATYDTDGPAGINYFLTSSFGTGYCSELLIAQTWNEELSREIALGITDEAVEFGFAGWYGPAMNLHRSAFGGRNFEYYSEDPYLSSVMAMAACDGAYENGVYPYIKHFAFNEQETNRNAMLCTWLTEQSARELYLKPFEACVKANEGEALAVMSCFNFIGSEWGGGYAPLMNTVLRDEWGFRGMVLSDYFGDYGYMDADRAIRGGTDSMLGTTGGRAIVDDESATSVLAMRQAAKNIMYTVVNSVAYEDYTGNQLPKWIVVTYGIDTGIAVILIAWEILSVLRYRKKIRESVEVIVEEK
ncbi:glycoside hydrolase family 3 C-terminal domain-containing protein [Blautia sp.]|uniref:glycoside hydrolase family 3 C-terminal domain-containing protein n=1 Tax=Blautia sp. TaxID=1955243 RepID=UPI003AB12661